MTTETSKRLAAIKAELKFIGREVNNLQTQDFEAVDAIMHALENIGTSVFQIELDAQPANEDDALAA